MIAQALCKKGCEKTADSNVFCLCVLIYKISSDFLNRFKISFSFSPDLSCYYKFSLLWLELQPTVTTKIENTQEFRLNFHNFPGLSSLSKAVMNGLLLLFINCSWLISIWYPLNWLCTGVSQKCLQLQCWWSRKA